jgi:phytoene desaturase
LSKKIVVVGAGLGGLTAAALLAKAGHDVTVLENNSWIGGKSRRIEVAGQRIDTGPSLITFPEVLEELFNRYDKLGAKSDAKKIAHLTLEKLPEVGRYFYRDKVVNLPVEEGHEWFAAWKRFDDIHGALSPEITKLLTTSPFSMGTLKPVGALTKNYGLRLSTSSYLKGLKWLPDGLREIIAIHTLNAGISPERTLALYATMPAVMAREGISVPVGGVYEIALALGRMATKAGAKILTNTRVTSIRKGLVQTSAGDFPADVVVGATDAQVMSRLLGKKPNLKSKASCSGVALFVTLKEPFPANTVTHSVIMPRNPEALHNSLDAKAVPTETMAFLNYYKPGHIYPNTKATAAILLTAPANGEKFELSDPFIQNELKRISKMIGLDFNIAELIEDYKILDPSYFAEFGANGGSLYGSTRTIWSGGPFHFPTYNSLFQPWLWRVGASVHPGGGVPAVIGGAMISMSMLLKRIGSK